MGNKIKTLRGDEIHKTYDFKETLGKGSFAEVKRAIRRKDKQEFAIKVISKSKLNSTELAVIHDEVSTNFSSCSFSCLCVFVCLCDV